jgi:aryl-alcohol dehydrogenase-like predicted oxidoreductase
MHKDDRKHVSRRHFIQTGLASTLVLGTGGVAKATEAVESSGESKAMLPVPTRPLGRSGVDVPMISLGGGMGAHSPQYLESAWASGIRYFDTAQCYLDGRSEKHIGTFLKHRPERRKDLFLVTKCHPYDTPRQMLTMIDDSLKTMNTDYIDLFFMHWLNPDEYGAGVYDLPKSEELKEVAQQLKESGKARLVGFSCHHNDRARIMMAAAQGGYLDGIMFSYSPFLKASDELSEAMDACHEAGIGLISMKEMRAHSQLPKHIPESEQLGLTSRQLLLQACWSDPRIASICSSMDNLDQIKENTDAARLFKGPLETAAIEALRTAALANHPSMCPNCDGRCERACGQALALNDIARYVTYYERDGNLEARHWYRQLSAEQREIRSADLDAARQACLAQLDFADILDRARTYFG